MAELDDPTGFAERVLEVIDSGRRTATYKLALLLALIDLCARESRDDGSAPGVLYTRDVAEAVTALYWRQVTPFGFGGDAVVLRQITSTRAAIVDAVRAFKAFAGANRGVGLLAARHRFPQAYAAMVDRVEVTIAEQPLPRLQTVGSSEVVFPFLYDLEWGTRESFSVNRLRGYGEHGAPIRLRPGAGDELIRLAPLVRPLIELHWTRMVATLNGVAKEEERLHRHLFGAARLMLPPVLRAELAETQRRRCFYCGNGLGVRPEADHFIARTRGGADAIENLVLADRNCNNDKRDLLAARVFVERWVGRNVENDTMLASLAAGHGWETDGAGVLAVAKSIYGHLPTPSPFWAGHKDIRAEETGPALAVLMSGHAPSTSNGVDIS